MNEENPISYYAVIPATVRYDNELKASEKLLYGEITSLANRMGYCFASNRYFANLYNVTVHTVSQWFSHLEKLGYIYIEFIKNTKNNALQERRIYIRDIPYVQKNTYPYVYKSTYPIYKNVQHNNIKYNIDDLFYLIINNDSEKISNEFLKIIERLEFNYTNEMLNYMQEDKIAMLKNIIFVLYNLYINDYGSLLAKTSRESLINLYKSAEQHSPSNLLNYYKKSIINNTT